MQQQMTVVGRASPGGPVDDLTLISGHWATQPGQVVLLTDGQGAGVRMGTQITVTGVPGSPRLTVVGSATSITQTAQAWVAPTEIAALRAPGMPDVSADAVPLLKRRDDRPGRTRTSRRCAPRCLAAPCSARSPG